MTDADRARTFVLHPEGEGKDDAATALTNTAGPSHLKRPVVEEPPGEKRIDYHENGDQWVSGGDVLRCIIVDAAQNGEVTIHIDDQQLSLAEDRRCKRQ